MHLSKDELLFVSIIIAATFSLLLLFFITVIVLNVRLRKKKQIEKLEAVIATEENERKRIAEDMHDELGPMLSAIKLKVSMIKNLESDVEIEKIVSEIINHLDSTIQNVREIIRNLSPTNLTRYGLVKSLEEFGSLIEGNKKIKFQFTYEGMEERLKESAEISLYRILVEMIHNSIRHSDCTVIQLIMKMYCNQLMILYSDNGTKTFEEGASRGMGISNIHNRVRMLSGVIYTREENETVNFYQIILNKSNIHS